MDHFVCERIGGFMLNRLNTVQSNCIYATVSEEWTDEGYEGGI